MSAAGLYYILTGKKVNTHLIELSNAIEVHNTHSQTHRVFATVGEHLDTCFNLGAVGTRAAIEHCKPSIHQLRSQLLSFSPLFFMQSGGVDTNAPHNATLENRSISYFTGSENVTVNNSTFTAVSGDYYVLEKGHDTEGLRVLSQTISHGAMFDSAERYPVGKCYPGTREEVQTIILDWINDPDPDEHVLWLFGSAGVGKSSIAQSIAEIARDLGKRYAASFFFARSVAGRNGATTLFPTLAYQIAIQIPDARDLVNDAVLADPTITTKSLDVQLRTLIIGPLSCLTSISHTPTVIVDGLDECGNSQTQRDVLRLLAKAITEHRVPLRFLVVSRPEYWIRTAFDGDLLNHITKRVSLSDSIDADNDIKAYLEDGFNEIYTNNLDIMASINKPWPPPNVITHLVNEASGQFIYATTILKFVGSSSDFSDPQAQLDMITQPGPTRSSAFGELDNLYSTILSLYPRRDSLLAVLGGLITGSTPKAIELFLGVSSVEFQLVLRAISALVTVKIWDFSPGEPEVDAVYGDRDPEVSFCHLSFREYLQDKSRSSLFWVDTQAYAGKLIDGFSQSVIECIDGSSQYFDKITIAKLDRMWHAFSTKTIFLVEPSVVYRHIQRLVDKLSQLQDKEHDHKLAFPQYILRHLDYVMNLAHVINNPFDFFDTNPFDTPDLKTLFSTLRLLSKAIAFRCIEYILSEAQNRDLLTNVLLYVLLSHSITLDDLGRMPGCNQRMAKTFLLDYWCLVACTDIEGSDSDRVYYNLPSVQLYFEESFQGGERTGLHAKGFLVTYRCLKHLLYRYDYNENFPRIVESRSSLFQDITSIINNFLSDMRFSNVDTGEQFIEYAIESLITFLWEFDWTRLRLVFGHYFTVAVSIANWIDRHLTAKHRADMFESIYPGSVFQLQDVMEHMYDEVFLPTFQVPFFSELSVYDASCIRTVILKPRWAHNGRSLGSVILDEEERWGVDVDNVYIQSYIYTRTGELDGILSRAGYLEHDQDWYTTLLEFYLNTLVKRVYHSLHPEFQSYALLVNSTEVVMGLVHRVDSLTEKMVKALMALYYLSQQAEPKAIWSPTHLFCSEIIKLLQRGDPSSFISSQEISYLIRWLIAIDQEGPDSCTTIESCNP
ncbi:hypothetical protein JR316_0001615 [Psilocybe cubensis]|uniref:Nephrocystin 3-like N-terminal domain-containing protein n=2 Tax=Psilocybe cubensis TaxID=181762 RepID=A0A8H7Y6F1_PSICU|nr:hypothetical protein JR316_0001615 [Psilocybe cubensis]KAH9484715.1 hypothetical protein JR316_0001615 [Psilocybe cubensis]